jgi:hypothetical protein
VKFHEPSLVPLADMLTNTVGITLFILIFTVLTTGGVVIAKRLPMEQKTQAEPLHFVCVNNRLLPLDFEGLAKKFVEPLGEPTYKDFGEWVRKYNTRQIEDEYFVVRGKGEVHYTEEDGRKRAIPRLSVKFTPRDGQGETIMDLQESNARFRQLLRAYTPKKYFVYFDVYPDSLDIFEAARKVAVESHFSTGWEPQGLGETIGFCLGKSCGGHTPVKQ